MTTDSKPCSETPMLDRSIYFGNWFGTPHILAGSRYSLICHTGDCPFPDGWTLRFDDVAANSVTLPRLISYTKVCNRGIQESAIRMHRYHAGLIYDSQKREFSEEVGGK